MNRRVMASIRMASSRPASSFLGWALNGPLGRGQDDHQHDASQGVVKELAGIGGPAEQLRTGSVAQNGRTCTSDQEEAPPEEAPPKEEAPAHKERRGHRCTPL